MIKCNVCCHYFIFMVGNEGNTGKRFHGKHSIKVGFNRSRTNSMFNQEVSMISSMNSTVR